MTTPTTKEIAEKIAADFLGDHDLPMKRLADAIDEALHQRDERAARIAVKVINDARGEGETDLRCIRERINYAIRRDDKQEGVGDGSTK